MIGKLFSLHKLIAVKSIIFKFLLITSIYEISSYFVAPGFFSGSESKTPSTLVPLMIASAFISTALNDAAVSVLKYGCPVPAPKITTLPFPNDE